MTTSDRPVTGLTVADAARLLGVSGVRVRQWANEGRIAVMRNDKGHRRFAPAEVERFIAERAAGQR